MPQAAIVIAKATLIPHAYARKTPSRSDPEKNCRSSVAPVVVTSSRLTFGAVWASLCASWLAKPDCAAASKKVLPIDRYPVTSNNSQVRDARRREDLHSPRNKTKGNSHIWIAVVEGMSAGTA